MSKKWRTSITKHENGETIIRGYKLLDLISEVNFTQAIFLLLKSELPNEKEEKVMNAILVACIDHGIEAPSTTVARLTASSGVPSSTAIASGVNAIGEFHGGAGEAAAKLFQENVDRPATEIVEKYKEKEKRIPGYGHKIYETDPRALALLKTAHSLGFHGKYVKFALEIQKELELSSGKKLPLNIDGAIAALLSELGFDYRLGKNLFVISRVVGLSAHVFEEQTREKPLTHRLEKGDVEYDGPSGRRLT